MLALTLYGCVVDLILNFGINLQHSDCLMFYLHSSADKKLMRLCSSVVLVI